MVGRIFHLNDKGEAFPMEEKPYDAEKALQQLLAEHPDLLAGDQMESIAPRRWLLIRREMKIPSTEEGSGRWSVDHLFLDQDAIPTLVEVKRGTDTRLRREVVGQMLDYAANAVVYWPAEQIRAQFEANTDAPDDALSNFLDEDTEAEEFWEKVKTNLQAGKIRMVFVADVIPSELRRIVEFLNEQMDPADVVAVEIRQYVGGGMTTLVPRVVGQTARKKPPVKKWEDWESALASVENAAVVSYFQQELSANRESYLPKRLLHFRPDGKRRLLVAVRKGKAYVRQNGRFVGDIEFWKQGISDPDAVTPIKNGGRLSFVLVTKDDFQFFHHAATNGLDSVEWSGGSPEEEID